MSILVTGDAFYIGSHTCVEPLLADHEIVVFDNFNNSHSEALRRVERITGRELSLVEDDIRDQAAMRQYQCQAIIHFAGLKAVGEPVKKPFSYYDNNAVSTYRLLAAMQNYDLSAPVFSWSAIVYGEPQRLPLTKAPPLSATNPYCRSTLIIVNMLHNVSQANSHWRIAILLYFNPVGAHESGLIDEDPQDVPNNLMPYKAPVAVGRRESLNVWESNAPTHDGTGVRDYIHVVDLALGHLRALERLDLPQCVAINLDTEVGYSILDVAKAFESANRQRVPYRYIPVAPVMVRLVIPIPHCQSDFWDWKRSAILPNCAETTDVKKTQSPRLHMNSHAVRSISPPQIVCSTITNRSLFYGLDHCNEGIAPIVFAKDAQGKALVDAEVIA